MKVTDGEALRKLNTLPFPDLRVIDVNEFCLFAVKEPGEIAMSGVLYVAYSDVHVMDMESKMRLADEVIERSEISLEICLVSVIVNAFRVCIPSLADSMHSPLLTSTMVDAADDSQYACIVTLDVTVNPVFNEECVAV